MINVPLEEKARILFLPLPLALNQEIHQFFTRDQIAAKGNSLDLGLIRDESILDYEDLPDPIESAQDCIDQLEMAADLIKEVVH